MKKTKFLLIIWIFSQSSFSIRQWKNMIPNYSFENAVTIQKDVLCRNNGGISQLKMLRRKTHYLNNCINKNYRTIKEEKDSVKSLENKTTFHGVFIRISNYPLIYSLGYEYEIRKNKNAFGIDVGTAINGFNNPPSGYRYVNLYMGFSPFYEYGKRWGFRVGLQIGATINPICFTDKLRYTPPADRPNRSKTWEMINIGVFYRTHNEKWKLMLSVYSGHFITFRKRLIYPTTPTPYQTGFINVKNTWENYFNLIPSPGLTVKYNFKITSK